MNGNRVWQCAPKSGCKFTFPRDSKVAAVYVHIRSAIGWIESQGTSCLSAFEIAFLMDASLTTPFHGSVLSRRVVVGLQF